ncbi:endonuclease III [Candidatus Dependentiae bacterium]|nr:endonuclease III [Candidatus Dependentiae bacterium]
MAIEKIIKILRKETKNFNPTLIKQIIIKHNKDPFLILICCLLSLRSKDIVTINVCNDLIKKAQTPKEILNIPLRELEKIIFKIGFYKNKAKVLHKVSKEIIEKYDGKVPKTEIELLELPGVGRKTANLVLGLAFNKPAICVDIHVHRISNRLGIIKTKTPEKTEFALKKIIPKKYWIEWNDLLVRWGQNICTPISPKCSQCKIKKYCKQIGVIKHR